MLFDRRIAIPVSHLLHDHPAGLVAKSLVNPRQIFPPGIVVPIKYADLRPRLTLQNPFRVNDALHAKRRKKSHGPGKMSRIIKKRRTGLHKKLWHLPLIQIIPRRQISLRPKRTKHQQHAIPLHQFPRQFRRALRDLRSRSRP